MQNERKSQKAKLNVKSAKTDTSPSHKNNRRPRKKRKRICMPSNWKNKQSPNEKLRKPKPKTNLHGKELDVRVKAPEPVNLKIKENGDVSFQKAYNLRKRGTNAKSGNLTQQISRKKTVVDKIIIDTDSVTSEPRIDLKQTRKIDSVSLQSIENDRLPPGKIFEKIMKRDVKVVVEKLNVRDLGSTLKSVQTVDASKGLEIDDGDQATLKMDNDVNDVLLGHVTDVKDDEISDKEHKNVEVKDQGNGEQTNNTEVDFVIEDPVVKVRPSCFSYL